jgi:hypothetical protein
MRRWIIMRLILTTVIELLLFGLLAVFWFAPPVLAGPDGGITPTPAGSGKPAAQTTKTSAAKFDFIGVKKCSMCHRSEEKGAQLQQWKTTAHAKAFATLAGEKAKEIAAARKLPKPPQESAECLKCHVTAFPVMANVAAAKITLEEGVSCESCHGPGSEYQKLTTMRAISAGTQDGKAVGLIMPTAQVCQQCHNEESPTFKGFKFEEMAAKIAHPDPTRAKAKK